MIRTQRSFAALLATVATVCALMVPASASADKTLQIDVSSLGAIVCPIVGTGTGGLNGVLLALKLRICPS
jgi:ribose/xylose/arabinose/galactoside ABC-type transport system permease subunit